MKREIRRQSVHLVLGTGLAIMLSYLGLENMKLAMAAMLAAGFVLAKIIQSGRYVPFFSEMVGFHERSHEKHLPGLPVFHYFLGVSLVLVLFTDLTVILGAILCLAFGDSATTFFGMKFGRTKIGDRKSLEGTIGGIITCLLILSLFFDWFAALVTAVFAMLAELLPINDSYTIPLTAAIVLTLLL